MSHRDPRIVSTMFVNWASFGVMGPGMFGFGVFVATGTATTTAAARSAHAYCVLYSCQDGHKYAFALIVRFPLILAAVFIGHARITLGQYFLEIPVGECPSNVLSGPREYLQVE
jgi:hypothetical protein